MAATVELYVYTSTNAATESSSAQTGISFLSIDSDATDGTTRQNNPVSAGSNSFSKHLRLKATGSFTYVENFQWWTDGSGTANVNMRAKESQGTGGASPGTGDATPSATALTGDIDAYSRTSGSKGTWDSAQYTSAGHVTKSLILQLQPTGAASPGAITQETINYQYDEV